MDFGNALKLSAGKCTVSCRKKELDSLDMANVGNKKVIAR